MRRVSMELLGVGIVATVISLASMVQLLLYMKQTPSGFVYPLVHNYEQDYYWYLSLMRQGIHGSLLVTSRYTPEVFPPQLVNTLFPVLGFIGSLSGVSLPVVYTVARLVFGVGLILAGYHIAADLFETRRARFIALILMIAGSPLWYIRNGVIMQMGEFWTGFDPILRITWLPHHTAANTLLILSLILLLRSSIHKKLIDTIGATLAAAGTAWFNPASGLALVFIASVIGVFFLVKGPNRHRRALVAGIMIVAALIPLVILYRFSNSVFPWTVFRDWERFVFYPIDVKGFVGVLGVVGIVAIASVPFALKKSNPFWWGIVAWFLWPLLGLGLLSRWIPLSNSRYLQTVPYIPAAILSTLGICQTVQTLKRYMRSQKFGEGAVVSCIVILSLPTFIASVNRQQQYVRSNAGNPLIFVSVDTTRALDWLASNSRSDSVVLAPPHVSPLIPAMSGNRVLLGHPTFTINREEKERDMMAFYGFGDTQTRRRILGSYVVDYVWIETTHKAPEEFLLERSFVRVYSNASVRIYEGIHK